MLIVNKINSGVEQRQLIRLITLRAGVRIPFPLRDMRIWLNG